MQSFRHSFVVDAPIEKLWDFYTRIKHLEVITPPSLKLRVLRFTDDQLKEGSEVWLTGNLMIRSNWHSKITVLKPYEYIDEMISGRFRVWKHTHKFQEVAGGRTEVIDEIDFELHYGPIGRLFEGYVRIHLGEIFAHRKEATIAEFKSSR